MDTGINFATYITGVRYEDIPAQAIEIAKMDILDTIGVAVAGSAKPGAPEVMSLLQEWGGKEESTVICFGRKVPSPDATLVNSTMAHALDYDDADDDAVVHAGVSVVPAAFAIAERQGGIDGKEFVTAVVLGVDLICRMARAVLTPIGVSGFMHTSMFGCLGAAAVTSRLMGLDENKTANALGIAYGQVSGNTQCVMEGAHSKRMQPAFAARAGVLSALLAERGITGPHDILQGEAGLYRIYFNNNYNPKALTDGLGQHFEIVNLSFKPYPCCRNLHTSIEAALKITRKYNIPAKNIRQVVVSCNEWAIPVVCEPRDRKQNPRDVVDAQFSIPWAVASAIVKGSVTLEDFTPEAIRNPLVLEVAQKVKTKADKDFPNRGATPATVQIVMNDNKAYAETVNFAKGSPLNAMTWEELILKFKECVPHGVKPLLSQTNIQTLIALITSIENVEDVGQIISLAG